MTNQTRFEHRLDMWLADVTTPRGAAIVIAVAMISITVSTGVLMTILDRENYPTIGSGLWWAVQTTTTVGNGYSVPTTYAGRFLAALRDVGRDRLSDGHHRRDHEHVRGPARATSRRSRAPESPTAGELRQIGRRLERIGPP